ncbi:NACHT domain-containing protein [Microbacterium rhizosphaerae]|uniref:NACHT domain-containing protein n=1 Tax=Microbacterium rhizosphaerae TaxID=1678237 RepID=A0ABZ0SRN0_9MICO|nr:NACHT domain-containing protein [Microbacterium rhizosphaerae]WPR91333.1 NACHT domain-containing protein [Microbacterium rhizosphaerae]
MLTTLPGDEPASEIGLGIFKAVLKLAGGEKLADALGELTGLGRATVEGLSQRALEAVAHATAVEFNLVAEADREWAESILVQAYCRVASAPDAVLAGESLTGAESLAAWVFGVGIVGKDRSDLEEASEDVRSYFQLISRSMATLVCNWYRTDPRANQAAVSSAAGAVLATVREILVRVGNLEGSLTSQERGSVETSTRRLISSSLDELNRPPEYYPDVFDSEGLASSLEVTELDERNFIHFGGTGLYWEGTLWGERQSLPLEAVRPGELTVLLGNPGSGKSTIAKGLVVHALQQGQLALYCRLEDFSRVCTGMPDQPAPSAVISAAQAASIPMTVAEGVRIASSWDPGHPPLIVLDGLDELATASDYAVARRAAKQLANAGHPVLVSSRVAGYTTPWEGVHRHVAIWPLNEHARDLFAERWFASTGDVAARARYVASTSSGALDEVLTNPLTLGFVCMLAHYGHVPSTAGAIFNRFIDHFLRAQWRDPAQQRISPAQIGRLKQAAEEVAWAMANFGHGDDLTWLDIVELDTIERATRDQSPYETYATGLLIPHGPVEPLGGTQQRARWLHRALQENFVAQRMAALIETDDPSWQERLLRATFSMTWRGALAQTFMLLGERGALKPVLSYFMAQLRIGDSPLGHMAEMLTVVASHSAELEERQKAADILIAQDRWDSAEFIDPVGVIGALHDRIRLGQREFGGQIWPHVYRSNSPGARELLVEAHQVGCADQSRELASVVMWLELECARFEDVERIVDSLCLAKDPPNTWFLRPLEEPIRSVAVDRLASLLRRPRLQGCPSLRRVHWIWQAIVGDEEASRSTPTDPDLLVAVIFGRKLENMDREMGGIRQLLRRPLANEDIMPGGVWMETQGSPVPVVDRDYLAFARIECELWEAEDSRVEELLSITDLSQPLAIAILQEFADQCPLPTTNRRETLMWTLAVLRRVPSVEAIPWLVPLRTEAWAEWEIDANFLYSAIGRQCWDLLAERVLAEPTSNPSWDAEVLLSAANYSDGPNATIELGRELRIAYYLEGMRRWASDRNRSLSLDDIGYLEDLDRGSAALIVTEIEALVRECDPSTANALLTLVERSLVATGQLGQFWDRLRVRASADQFGRP